MKITATFSSFFIASAIAFGGCSQRPAEDVNATTPAAETTADQAKADTGATKKKAVTKRATARAKPANVTTARARVAETVTPPTKIKNVQPVYPAIARAARVEGSVVLAVDVDENGKVSQAKVIRSVPLLDQAALEAVRQWEYTPMRRGDMAVPTTMTVTVNFTRA